MILLGKNNTTESNYVIKCSKLEHYFQKLLTFRFNVHIL